MVGAADAGPDADRQLCRLLIPVVCAQHGGHRLPEERGGSVHIKIVVARSACHAAAQTQHQEAVRTRQEGQDARLMGRWAKVLNWQYPIQVETLSTQQSSAPNSTPRSRDVPATAMMPVLDIQRLGRCRARPSCLTRTVPPRARPALSWRQVFQVQAALSQDCSGGAKVS